MWGGVVVAGVVLLTTAAILGVKGVPHAGQTVQAVQEAGEPAWTADPELVNQLMSEELVGNYTIRPYPDMQRQVAESYRESPTSWSHFWNTPNVEFMMIIKLIEVPFPTDDSVRDPTELRGTAEGEMNDLVQRCGRPLAGQPDLDYGRIGELRFVRLSY